MIGMADLDQMFPVGLSDDEKAAGFVLMQVNNPQGHYSMPFGPPPDPAVYAVVRQLPGGLRAVKVERPDGEVQYAIWDASGRPVQTVAQSIEELLARFP